MLNLTLFVFTLFKHIKDFNKHKTGQREKSLPNTVCLKVYFLHFLSVFKHCMDVGTLDFNDSLTKLEEEWSKNKKLTFIESY